MIREFPLPDLGEGLTESEIVAWRVAVGDRVELNQIIADVETAKAVVELPSPYAGVITALHAAEGETVNVGEPLFSCDTGDGRRRAPDGGRGRDCGRRPLRRLPRRRRRPHRSHRRSRARCRARTQPGGLRRPRRGRAEAAHATCGAPRRSRAADRGRGRRGCRAAGRPRPRRHAGGRVADDGRSRAPALDAAGAQARARPRHRPRRRDGHGGARPHHAGRRGGRGIRRRHRAAETESTPTAARAGADRPAETRIPIKGVRKHTAAAMVRSAFTAPHVTEFLTIDVTATMELLRGIREDRAFAGHRVDAAHGRREGALHRRRAHARGELPVGRGRPGDRAASGTSTSASPRRPTAGSSCRTSRAPSG